MSTHASDAAPIVSFRVAAVLFLPVKDSRFIISGGCQGVPLLPWDYKGDACRYVAVFSGWYVGEDPRSCGGGR